MSSSVPGDIRVPGRSQELQDTFLKDVSCQPRCNLSQSSYYLHNGKAKKNFVGSNRT